MLSVKSRVYTAENNVRVREYLPVGNTLDYAAYNFPKVQKFKIGFEEDLEERRRVSDTLCKIYDANNIPDSDRQTPVVSDSVDYLGTINGMIYFDPATTKDLTNDELAYALSHEVAHNLCSHSEIQKKMYSVHKELDTVLNIKDEQFDTVLCRTLEYEADIFGGVLCKKAGFDVYAYRTETGKHNYQFEKDIGEFNLFSTHPSVADRIALLDSIDFNHLKFDKKKFDNRLERINNAVSLEDKLNLESDFYSKFSVVFLYEGKKIQKRIDKIESLSDERKLQYDRALKSLKLSYKNIPANAVEYRRMFTSQLFHNLSLVRKAKHKISENLSLHKKIHVIVNNIVNNKGLIR